MKQKTTIILACLLLLTGYLLFFGYLEYSVSRGGPGGKLSHIPFILFSFVLIFSGTLLLFGSIKQKRIETGMLLFSILAGFIVCEAATQVWLKGIASKKVQNRFALVDYLEPKDRKFTPHHYLNYALTANFEKDGTTHNSLGFRGPEIEQPKPKDTFRIVAVGGSTTYTASVDNDDSTFTAHLQRMLAGTLPGKTIEVICAGAGGYTTFESLANLEYKLLDLTPDLVMIYHGVNDAHTRFVPPDLYRGDNQGYRKPFSVPSPFFWEYSAFFRVISRSLGLSTQVGLGEFVFAPSVVKSWRVTDPHSKKLPILLERLDKNPPVYFERNLRNMIAICKANEVDIMLATWAFSREAGDYVAMPHYLKAIHEHNAIVKKLCGELNVPLYDFNAEMPEERSLWSDGRHVNETGSRKKAELWSAFLKPLLLSVTALDQMNSKSL